jgi:hypothetical protein
MNIFNTLDLEYDIEFAKINHVFESTYDMTMIKLKELEMNCVHSDIITESDAGYVYEGAVKNLLISAKEFIEKIIAKLKEFFTGSKKEMDEEEVAKAKKMAEEIIKNPDAIKDDKIEVYDHENDKKELDKYIREMLKLERKVMNLKVASKLKVNNNSAEVLMEFQQLLREMDKLNDEYDSSLLTENDNIIKKAKVDAIRFSQKQLDKIKIDYDAVEKNSDKVLQLFKKDIDGCEIPEQLNLLQKLSNSIAARVRKFSLRISTYRHKSLSIILGLGAIVGLGTVVAYDMKNPDGVVNNQLKKIVNKQAQQHMSK